MTYEEMLNAKGGLSEHSGKAPFGMMVRMQKDGKFRDVFAVDRQWASVPAFREALKEDCDFSMKLQAKQQLHYEIVDDENLVLELEPGSYQSLQQLVDATPAVVAQSEFIDTIVFGLLAVMTQLHAKGVCHVCFSPDNVYVRKGDNMPMVLLHGSSFMGMRNMMRLYETQDDFIAPELKGADEVHPTAQSDIYSLGQLILWLFRQGSIPYEYKRVAEKATKETPDKRFSSAAKMAKEIESQRSKKNSFMMLMGALAVAAVCTGLYFELTPQTTEREFIEPAPKTEQQNYLEDGFDPELEMILESDSVDTLTAEEQHSIDEYMKKAEEIYRRRFAEKADGILSKVYNNESMNASEKTFMATSSAMSEELINLQNQLAEEAGISDAAANRIASEVISKIIAEKQKKISVIAQ